MTEIKWFSIKKDGSPKAADGEVSSDVLLYVRDDYMNYHTIRFGFYSYRDNDWYSHDGELICEKVTHWADAPSLPEVD